MLAVIVGDEIFGVSRALFGREDEEAETPPLRRPAEPQDPAPEAGAPKVEDYLSPRPPR